MCYILLSSIKSVISSALCCDCLMPFISFIHAMHSYKYHPHKHSSLGDLDGLLYASSAKRRRDQVFVWFINQAMCGVDACRKGNSFENVLIYAFGSSNYCMVFAYLRHRCIKYFSKRITPLPSSSTIPMEKLQICISARTHFIILHIRKVANEVLLLDFCLSWTCGAQSQAHLSNAQRIRNFS